MPDARPNILVFMSDQEQADVVHPEHPCITPNASRLAREGVLFRRAYCPTAHCCPSRATFMTGVYPSRHGIYNNVSTPTAIHYGLNPGLTTFSEVLRRDGYQMAYAGKWHVSNEEGPADRGWDELYVTANKGAYMHRSLDQWRRQATSPTAEADRRPGEIIRPGWGNVTLYDTYDTDPVQAPRGYEETNDFRVVESALDHLPKLAHGRQPWCLFVGPLGPHDPYVVPEQFARLYDPKSVPLPPSFADTLEDKPRIYQRVRRQYWDQLSEDEVRDAIAHYWAYCSMEDALFGLVLDALDATGQAEDTLVLRTSDHGDYCAAHGLWAKGVPAFREGYSIPLVARWPAGIANPGRTVEEFVTLADVAPTLVDVAGLSIPEGWHGASFRPFLEDRTPETWTDAFFTQFNGVELYYSQRSVTTREYKYVYNGFDFDELYDLRVDPSEMANLADRPEYAEVKRNLVRRMWEFGYRTGDEMMFNPYVTVALAPFGPADALGGSG
jgi:arylsulfatase A-like enzyme